MAPCDFCCHQKHKPGYVLVLIIGAGEKENSPEIFCQEGRPYFHQKHVYFENKAQANHLLFMESFSIPKEALVCKQSEAVFRAFASRISLRTHLGSCSITRLSGHFRVPTKPNFIAKKMCNVFEDNRIVFFFLKHINWHRVGNRVPEEPLERGQTHLGTSGESQSCNSFFSPLFPRESFQQS